MILMSNLYLLPIVGSKIIGILETIRVKKLILNPFYEINICQITIFRLYVVYNKHEIIQISNQTREKSLVLSEVHFAVDYVREEEHGGSIFLQICILKEIL